MSKQIANKLTKKKLFSALAAGAASIYGQTDAEAGIQYTDSSANPITSNSSTPGGVNWDIDGDFTDEATIFNAIGTTSTIVKGITRINNQFRFLANSYKLAAQSSGAVVGTANTNWRSSLYYVFYNGSIYLATGFSDTIPGFFGFSFESGGSTLYGWAEATLTNGGTFGTFTISRWAYEDTGASITVGDTGSGGSTGAVPEPSSFAITGLGLLAAGASGVRRWRREKKDKAA